MRGEILTFDPATGSGLISGDDGGRYTFDTAALATPTTVRAGQSVDFVAQDTAATQIFVLGDAPTAPSGPWSQTAQTARPPADDGIAYHGDTTVEPTGPRPFNLGTALFSLKGRLRRSHFWICWALMVVAFWVTVFIPLVNLVAQIALLWTNVATGWKRFQDMGRPGWLILLPWALLVVMQVVLFASIGMAYFENPTAFDDADPQTVLAMLGPAMLLGLFAYPLSLGFWLWLGIGDSQRGLNKYGPNPKGE